MWSHSLRAAPRFKVEERGGLTSRGASPHATPTAPLVREAVERLTKHLLDALLGFSAEVKTHACAGRLSEATWKRSAAQSTTVRRPQFQTQDNLSIETD
jgi:hypothetical protein